MANLIGKISTKRTVVGSSSKTETLAASVKQDSPELSAGVGADQSVVALVAAKSSPLSAKAMISPGGTFNHNQLINRDVADQHPIGAITGLRAELNRKGDDVMIDTDTGRLHLTSGGQKLGVGIEFPDALAFDGGYQDEAGYVHLTLNGEDIDGFVPFLIAGGGGSGSANGAVLKVSNTTGWLFTTVAFEQDCILTFNWSSIEDEISTGNGTLQVYVANVLKGTASIEQGDIAVNVSEYLSSGSNSVKLAVTDVYGNSRNINFTIEVISLSISSTFDGNAVHSGEVSYFYVPTGAVEKKIHFILDGTEIGTDTVMLSGQQQDFTIPAQPHGSHTFEVYAEAKIGDSTVKSKSLYYDLPFSEPGNTTPIIASTFRPSEVEQYDTFVIPYRVYNPSGLTAEIVLAENGNPVKELTVDRTEHQWSHRIDEVGDAELTITCGETVKRFIVPVIESTIKVTAVTNNLLLDLSAHGRSNLEPDPLVWESNGVSCEFENFNLTSDAWQIDDDGVTVMRVSGDARLQIPIKPFETDIRTTGLTIELEFATNSVRNYQSTLISCMDGGRGITLTSQEAFAASAQSSLGTQYKEEEHIRLTFVIGKRTGTRMMLCYLNGICSGSIAYPDDDDFVQNDPVVISVGSSECTIDLYHIRIYKNDLTRHQVVTNWIADTQIGSLKKDRWARNDIYDDYGNVVISKLPKDLPYMVLVAPALPTFKGDKKTISGYYVDPVDPKKSYTFDETQIDVQGTSSQYYKIKNFKIKYKNGFNMPDGTVAETYALNDKGVPVDTFTMKADVASSESANNVVLAQLFNDLCPTKTPAQIADPRVRQTIDGHPCVIFWDKGDGPKFLGDYNYNNDKGTDETFGFKAGDQSWEMLENGTELGAFISDDFTGDGWKTVFEARYPEDNTDTTWLASFVSWVASTNTKAATNEELDDPITYSDTVYTHDTAEYRLAKFVNELSNWADIDHSIFYYLFTLYFLCIDQREKNAFPTYIADMRKMIWLFYDGDSALGINNKGALTFSPFLEDIDYTAGGDPVFNGQRNVFWTNIRLGFWDRVEEMYQEWRTNDLLSYDIVDGRFTEHQAKWPEALYNEDGYSKRLEPWENGRDATYLPMNLGKKELQRRWWLWFRERYMDSLFSTGKSMQNRILIRATSQADISLRAYVPIYGSVYYNALRVQQRMLDPGSLYLFPWSAAGAEDAVIGINDADLITDLGDLSPLHVETIDLSGASHLTYCKVGDGSEDYRNEKLIDLTLGNNTLLRSVDARNCIALTQSVDLSGCTNVEEAYFDGTSITGLSLPNGGVLKVLHLPETVVNLTLRNQTTLTDFAMPNYSNITTLWLENNSNVIDPVAILNQIPEKSRVRLIGMHLAVDSYDDIVNLIAKLDTMRGLDETAGNVETAQVSGTIYLEEVTQPQLNEIAQWQSRYPSLAVLYSRIETYTVRFWVDDVLTETVSNVSWGTKVEYPGETPTRPETESAVWEFTEWSPMPESVTADMDCHAQFRNTIPLIRLLVEGTLSGSYYNDRVTKVGPHAFSNMTMDELVLPNTTTIYEALFGSTITRVVIPAVTGWGYSPWMGLKADVVELRDITSIAFNTFNSARISAMIIRSRSIPSLNCSIPSDTYFYVYSDMVESYKVATNWSEYADKIRAIEDYPEITGGA